MPLGGCFRPLGMESRFARKKRARVAFPISECQYVGYDNEYRLRMAKGSAMDKSNPSYVAFCEGLKQRYVDFATGSILLLTCSLYTDPMRRLLLL